MYPTLAPDWVQYAIDSAWYQAEYRRGPHCATINPIPNFFPEETYDL